MYKRILVATDGSKLSGRAVTHAIGLARAVGAEIVAFHASPDYRFASLLEGTVRDQVPRDVYEAAATREAETVLEAIRKKAESEGVTCTIVHEIAVSPWEAILDVARRTKADAIVMASHGRRGIAGMLLGSETQKVLSHTKLPVTVVR